MTRQIGAEVANKNSAMTMSFLVFFSCFMEAAHAQSLFPAIITFGDSTVDVGNNDYLPTIFKAGFPPYGRDFLNHTPTGRFCNGKLATDIVAGYLGFTTYPHAYLSPQASGKNLLIGANFASAASGYYDKTATMYNAIPLHQQLQYYTEYQSKLSSVAGNSNAESIISKALHIVSTGASDFVLNYYISPGINKFYTSDEFTSLLINIFSSFIKELYGLGARRIGVTSLPPLGCLPASMTLFGYGERSCVRRLNNDAQGFNRKLNATVRSLSKQLPNLKIVFLNIYDTFIDLISSPYKHGFSEVRKGCCGTGTIETAVLCNSMSPGTCPNATRYVFWDSVHPSQAANQLLAVALISQAGALF